jgi:putative restriction endonuclease
MPEINHNERAIRIWKELIRVAKTEQNITYGELGQAVDIHHRALRVPLDLIQYYCRENTLPPLTILVVRRDTRRPGNGLRKTVRPEEHQHSRKQVFCFDWGKYTRQFVVEMKETKGPYR